MKDHRTLPQDSLNSSRPERLYSRVQAAEMFGCAESTIRRWVREGRLKDTRPTQRTIRISGAELERFVRESTK